MTVRGQPRAPPSWGSQADRGAGQSSISEDFSSPSRPRTGRPPLLSDADRAVLKEMAESLPGSSVAVLTTRFCTRIGRRVSTHTVERAAKKMGVCPSQHGNSVGRTPTVDRPKPNGTTATRYQPRHRPEVSKDGGYPSDLTDAQWALVEPLLTPKRHRHASAGRPPPRRTRGEWRA